jgi:hypothetical protein
MVSFLSDVVSVVKESLVVERERDRERKTEREKREKDREGALVCVYGKGQGK